MKEKDAVIASLRDMEESYKLQLDTRQNDLDTSRQDLLNKSFEIEDSVKQLSAAKAAIQ